MCLQKDKSTGYAIFLLKKSGHFSRIYINKKNRVQNSAPVARVRKIQVSSVHTEQPDTPGFAALLS